MNSNARILTLRCGDDSQRYGFFPRMNYKLLGETRKPAQCDHRVAKIILGALFKRIIWRFTSTKRVRWAMPTLRVRFDKKSEVSNFGQVG